MPPWLVGLLVTFILGLFFSPWLSNVVRSHLDPRTSSNAILAAVWPCEVTSLSEAGFRTGLVERVIFFAAVWISGAWWLLTSWLVFKTAIYWQGSDFTKFWGAPSKNPKYFIDVYNLRRYHAEAVVVGTGANIVFALVGFVVGKYCEGSAYGF